MRFICVRHSSWVHKEAPHWVRAPLTSSSDFESRGARDGVHRVRRTKLKTSNFGEHIFLLIVVDKVDRLAGKPAILRA